ncbi:MAG: hypothetical protein MJ124_09130 [Lachnospiraceae bacterium]|nr:hypothetical protein [Lachnospiraceae bacterium]
MADDDNALGHIFTYLLFVLIMISPIFITMNANRYMKTVYVEDEIKDYLEHVVVEGITEDNYAAFGSVMGSAGYDTKFDVYVDGEYLTYNEWTAIVKSSGVLRFGLGDFVAITASDGKVSVYRSQIIGEN